MAPISAQRSEPRRSKRLKSKMASDHELLQTKPDGSATCASTHCTTQRKNKMARIIAQSDVTLPDDVVIEILSWLLPKPFFRFKCVSKSWCALSSVAYDLNKHFQPTAHGLFYNTLPMEAGEVDYFSTNASSVGFVNFSAEASEVDNTFNISLDSDNLKVVDCCNGLLLVKGWDLGSGHDSDLYVYNPAIQNILAVWHIPPLKHLSRFYEAFSLAFDPCVQSQIHVVCFTGWCKEGVEYNYFQIFSFKTGKWKSTEKLGHGVRIITYVQGTFVEGRVHRLTTRKEILSIDPNRCSYQKTQTPHSHPSSHVYIGQSQGLLNFLTFDNNLKLSIWTLKSFHSQEWVLKHQLSRMNSVKNLVMHPGNNILFVASQHNRLTSVDLNTGKEEELCILPRGAALSHTSPGCIWVYMPYYL
ncbi:F-box family protein [Rhynchospora pubera]|uniref:F-box family protein n=1 Tax=Rhynchospora pubera TaxID=906938 RepID=A0AAV8CTM2_9POAL|nr:F-box family protein [Rhynchospora pubera]